MKTRSFLSVFYVVSLTCSLLFSSCSENAKTKDSEEMNQAVTEPEKVEDVKRINIDSLAVEMEIPVSMTSTTVLDKNVPCQFMDGDNELYIIGNREPSDQAKFSMLYMDKYNDKLSLHENYLNFTINLMKESKNKLSNVSKVKTINAKNMKGSLISVDGKRPNIAVPISYWIACFEYNQNVYKFIFWTQKSRKEEVEKSALNVFQSIRFM